METIAVKVGRNNAPDYEAIKQHGLAYSNRDHVMARRILGDIEPDFPYSRPSPLEFSGAVIATVYLPAVREALNTPSPLMRFLEED